MPSQRSPEPRWGSFFGPRRPMEMRRWKGRKEGWDPAWVALLGVGWVMVAWVGLGEAEWAMVAWVAREPEYGMVG